jgi:hypothetical protein
MFGHSQPFEQSLQHAQVHLQLGQSLQQSFVQQVPVLQTAGLPVTDVDVPAKLAAIRPAATTKPPKILTIIVDSLFWIDCGNSAIRRCPNSCESGYGVEIAFREIETRISKRFAFESNDPGAVQNAMRHRRRQIVVGRGDRVDLAGIDGGQRRRGGQRRD